MVFVNEVPGCVHNDMVECPEYQRNCKKCGWNPRVSRFRLKAFAEKHPELVEELRMMGKLPEEDQ